MLHNYALLNKENVVVGTMLMDDLDKGERPVHQPFVEIGQAAIRVGWVYDPDQRCFREPPPISLQPLPQQSIVVVSSSDVLPPQDNHKRKTPFSRWIKR